MAEEGSICGCSVSPVAVGASNVNCSANHGSVGGGSGGGGGDGVIKMGKRDTSSWKPRALKFFP